MEEKFSKIEKISAEEGIKKELKQQIRYYYNKIPVLRQNADHARNQLNKQLNKLQTGKLKINQNELAEYFEPEILDYIYAKQELEDAITNYLDITQKHRKLFGRLPKRYEKMP